MRQRHIELFLSAVSDEFRSYRDSLKARLKRPNVDIHVQEDFIATGTETLDKLDSYIERCDAVIHMAGDMTGSWAGPATLQALRARHGDLADRLPALKASLDAGDPPLSYTQWEAYLAVYHGKPLLLIAVPEPGTPRDANYGVDADQQASQRAHLERLRALGRFAEIRFQNADQLAAEILRSSILDLLAEAGVVTRPIVLPYPSIGSLFKGRGAFLQRLHEGHGRCRQTAIVTQALYGLGGIGKTRAAVEYAWAHAGEYTAVLFVAPDTPEAARRTLAAHSLVLVPTLHTPDDMLRRKAVLDWLAANPGWLLILDNVDTPLAMTEAEALLRDLVGGHVVITSRLANFSGDIEPTELGVLTADEAAAFLLERTKGRRRAASDDGAKAREVAAELGWLALALEQAAAYVSRKRTFDDYLAQWRSNRNDVLTWFDPTVTGYPSSVATTWKTSVAQLTDAGRSLLERLAWLAPEKVPEFLLDVAVPAAEGEDLRTALDDVAAYSLVTRDAEGPYFLVHHLVQDVTRRSLSDEMRRLRLVEALNWIYAAFPFEAEDVRTWPRAEALAPHALAVTEHAAAYESPAPSARLMNQLGVLLWSKALYADAEPLLRRALAIGEKSLGPDHPDVVACLNNLAGLLRVTNRLAEAEPLYRRALAIDEKSLGPDDPKVAVGLNGLAGLLQDTNRLAEAEPLYRRALAIAENSLGSDHPDVATHLNNLAGLLRATNRLAEAEPLLRRALAINEKSLGPNHPLVATNLNNLAGLLRATNRLAEAEPLYRRALAIDEKSLGPEHPNVAVGLTGLAGLLRATNRLAEAEPLYRRALAIDEKSLGPDHPLVATNLNNLAGLLRATSRLAETEPLLRRALAIGEKSLGTDHRAVAEALNNLAGLLQATNRLAEAEPLYRRALAINENSLGPDHPDVATGLNNLAGLLRATNRLAEAKPLVRRALAIFERALGSEHPSTTTVRKNLASLPGDGA
jgi:tetratricopeptide (TPR) repeat protein